MRDYHYYDGFQETNFFYDASPTSDNGYIAIGKARVDVGGTNQMWIVKVDSMGCDTAGCATGVFVEDLSPFGGGKGEELYVYPNPASYKINVKSKKIKEKGEKVIAVYNSQGLKVEEIKVPSGKETLIVDIEAWPQGIYFLILQINGKRAGSKKFIINR